MKKFKVLMSLLCLCAVLAAPVSAMAAVDSTQEVTSAALNEDGSGIVVFANKYPLGSIRNVIVSGLRLRRTPSLSGEIMGLLYPGDQVKIIGNDVSADGHVWINVEWLDNGWRGYIADQV